MCNSAINGSCESKKGKGSEFEDDTFEKERETVERESEKRVRKKKGREE